jgi:hypothetical protein
LPVGRESGGFPAIHSANKSVERITVDANRTIRIAHVEAGTKRKRSGRSDFPAVVVCHPPRFDLDRRLAGGRGCPIQGADLVEFSNARESLHASLGRAIDQIDTETITLRRLLELVGEHGLLFLCALLTIPFLIPVSIPGVSTVFGAAIVLIAVGITMNRMPWLPARIMDKELDATRLSAILRRGVGIVAKVETYIRPRMQGLTEGAVMGRVNGLALVFGGVLLMAPLGLIPFSNTLPAFAILLLAVGMSQRDGLVVLAGYGMLVATLIYFGALAAAAYAAGRGLAGIFS